MQSTQKIKKGAIEDYISDSAATALLGKLATGGYTGTAQDLRNEIASILANVRFLGNVTTSTVISGEVGNIYTIVTEPGTYTNWGGIVVPANTYAVLKRVDGNFSSSQTALDLTSYAKVVDVAKKADLDLLKGTDLEVIDTSVLTYENSTVSIGATGTLATTKLNSKVYPFIRIKSERIKFNLTTQISATFLILAGDANTVITLGLGGGGGSGAIHRWTSATDSSTLILGGTTPSIALGSPIEVVLSNGIYSIYANSTLYKTIDISTLSQPEYSKPTLGFIAITGNTALNVTGIFKSKLEYLSANSLKKADIINNLTSTATDKPIAANEVKKVNDRLVINEKSLTGVVYEVVTTEKITVEDFTYSINNVGSITGTKLNGRAYPALRVDSNKITYGLIAGTDFLIVAGDATSVVALGLRGGAKGTFFRFKPDNTLTSLGSITVPTFVSGIVTATYISGIYSIYDGSTLVATIDGQAVLGGFVEYAKPVLGVIIYSSFTSIPNLKAVLSDRFTYLESNMSGNSSAYKDRVYASLGDSIESEGKTQAIIVPALGIKTLQNLAVSGSSAAFRNADSGYLKYTSVNAGTNLITVNWGTNDFGTNIPLGVEGDTVNTTFYGALKIITEGLVTNHPTARIFWYTIQQRDYLLGGSQVAGMVNANGATVEQFNDAIKIMCRKKAIQVIDLYQDWGVTKENIDSFTSDRLHPNTAGHARRAGVIINKIKQYTL